MSSLACAGQQYINRMSAGASPSVFRCAQCEQVEPQCQCDKYCCLCQAVVGVRICADGLMYCQPCREACDYEITY